jgi:uncharacterized protein
MLAIMLIGDAGFFGKNCNMQVTLIIKPTKKCNALCKHCCVNKNDNALFTVDDVGIALDNFLNLPIFKEKPVDSVELIWHGGEPMILPPSFYYKVSERLSSCYPRVQFTHEMQSNLLLYDEKWDNVLGDVFKWGIGSSYDFCSSLRQTKSGVEYYPIWMEKVKRIQDKTGERVHTICVLNKENVNRVQEICQMAYETGLNIKLNELSIIGEARLIHNLAISSEEYGEALISALDFWFKHQDNGFIFALGLDFVKMTELSSYKMTCPINSTCTGYIFGLEPNGDFYNCCECADLKVNRFGNLLNGEFHMPNYIAMKSAEAHILPECIKCGICGGGCKMQRFMSYGHMKRKTPMCSVWKKFYASVKKLVDSQPPQL